MRARKYSKERRIETLPALSSILSTKSNSSSTPTTSSISDSKHRRSRRRHWPTRFCSENGRTGRCFIPRVVRLMPQGRMQEFTRETLRPPVTMHTQHPRELILSRRDVLDRYSLALPVQGYRGLWKCDSVLQNLVLDPASFSFDAEDSTRNSSALW
ncbi:hypothetical protein CPB83DRAFT_489949 [Crepidotus variabilis]|uniref:Uncharacterized protein n=1 Tax=Crepidotus variabilis TaxID=179855 RepID=A0A9P6JU03_9AGAR|nr:hypothetical protein CPB83DRAFT_489949 [Crepidotus variabilis]